MEYFKLKWFVLLPVPFDNISVVVGLLLPPSSITPSSETQEWWLSRVYRRLWLLVQRPVSGIQVSQVPEAWSPPQTWKPSWLCSSLAVGILTKLQEVLVLGTNISVVCSVPSPPVIRRPKNTLSISHYLRLSFLSFHYRASDPRNKPLVTILTEAVEGPPAADTVSAETTVAHRHLRVELA